jgi:hypothetical protein
MTGPIPDFENAVRWPVDAAELRLRMTDRFVARLPTVMGRIGDRVSELPAGSRQRRWLLTRSLAAGWAATSQADWDYLERIYDAGVVTRIGHGVPIDFPQRMTAWRETKAMLEEFHQVIREVDFRPVEALDPGGPFLGCRIEVHMRGRASGITVSQGTVCIYELKAGRIMRQWMGGTLEQTLEIFEPDLAEAA